MKFLILLSIVLLLPQKRVAAQSEIDSILNVFFIEFKTNHDSAISKILRSNKWISAQKITEASNGIDNAISQVGSYYGYDSLTVRRVTDKLQLRCYLLYYDRQPIRLNFIFYKPNRKWVLQRIYLDDDILQELEKSKNYLYNQKQ